MALLRRLRQRLGRFDRAGPLPCIIMYHRIADAPRDPWGLAVSPRNFEIQLRLLKQHRTVLAMPDFIALLERGALPDDAVSITFDDGYHDNLANAAPLLKAAGLPATLFLSIGPSRRGQPYWYDELVAMVLDKAEPADMTVALSDGPFRILLPEREAADRDPGGWRGWHPPRTAREALYHAGWKRIRAMPPAEQQVSMDRLRNALPIAPLNAHPLNFAQIIELLDGPSLSLGGHTMDHPDLASLTRDEAYEQIFRGKNEIDQFGNSTGGFAYPYGSYNESVTALVRQAGYRWACTTDSGFVDRRNVDLYRLPRIAVPDEGDLRFLNPVKYHPTD